MQVWVIQTLCNACNRMTCMLQLTFTLIAESPSRSRRGWCRWQRQQFRFPFIFIHFNSLFVNNCFFMFHVCMCIRLSHYLQLHIRMRTIFICLRSCGRWKSPIKWHSDNRTHISLFSSLISDSVMFTFSTMCATTLRAMSANGEHAATIECNEREKKKNKSNEIERARTEKPKKRNE